MDIVAYIFVAVGGLVLAFASLHGFENKSITIISFGAGAILLIIGGCFYWQDALWKRESAAKPESKITERPYLKFRATWLQPLVPGSYPVIEYQLENISKVEVSVIMQDATCQFAKDSKHTSFQYVTGEASKFTMVPTKVVYGQMRFTKHVLTAEEINALNKEPAQGRLAFYARGEYRDIAGGPTYLLDFCQLYNPNIAGNLIFCDPSITFTKANEDDK